jgi:hypothetical protein
MSFATATAILKTENPKAAMMIGGRLPYNSEKGAQTIGPNAYPRTNREVPSVATSLPTPNSASRPVDASEKILEEKVAESESKIKIAVMRYFVLLGQFWA